MTKYAKLISNTQVEFPPKNKGDIINYDIDYNLLIQDGYKEFINVERPETNRFYHIEYENNINNVAEVVIYDETQEEADERIAREEKQQKILEIDSKISELESLIIKELRLGNEENIQIYNEVIKRLEDMKNNL